MIRILPVIATLFVVTLIGVLSSIFIVDERKRRLQDRQLSIQRIEATDHKL